MLKKLLRQIAIGHGQRLALFLCVGIAMPRLLAAQSRCLAADRVSDAQIGSVKAMMHGTDERWMSERQLYKLPIVDDTAIAIVSDSAICASAGDAYNAALPSTEQVTGRKVYVVRVGSTRYIVWDPNTGNSPRSEFEAIAVLDDTFAVIAKIAG